MSHGRVPGRELIEDTTIAFERQRLQRYAAVEEQDQVTGRAPGGGVGRVGVLAGSGAEVGDLCAVVGQPEAPGVALGGVVIDDGGVVWPGDRGCADGELEPRGATVPPSHRLLKAEQSYRSQGPQARLKRHGTSMKAE